MERRYSDLSRAGYRRITRKLRDLLRDRDEESDDVLDDVLDDLMKRDQEQKIEKYQQRLGETGQKD